MDFYHYNLWIMVFKNRNGLFTSNVEFSLKYFTFPVYAKKSKKSTLQIVQIYSPVYYNRFCIARWYIVIETIIVS